ncbi:uncharacterized protein [Dermacentor albipictus]|uniref:uncharacterized protein n=1 Tax=Dermacentor albipictus TaxID=60249 RepID=UPI0038FBF08F
MTTAELIAGDLKTDEKTLGSQGPPQGSVISPMLFNLVMIQVAKRLCQPEGLKHTIYADDITLWVEGGSGARIKSTLQTAVDTIEERLEGTGLRCSPKIRSKYEKIQFRARVGSTIPTASKIRVQGMTLEALGRNGDTATRLMGKAANATRLLKRVTTKKGVMKEENFIRLIHSFVLYHIVYVAAFYKWIKSEKNKLDILIRRAYKTPLGLPETANTKRLLQLGIHNTLDEIAEAQSHSVGNTVIDKGRQKDPVKSRHHRSSRDQNAPSPTTYDGTYVDAAEYAGRNGFAIAVVDSGGNVRATASTSSKQVEEAEEIAIAMAIVDR